MKRIKNLSSFATASLLLMSAVAQADYNYAIDVLVGNEKTELDGTSIEQKYSRFDIQGRYYLEAVNIDNKPIREAAFIGRQSNISLAYSHLDADNTILIDDQTILAAAVDILIPDTQFRLGGSIDSNDKGLLDSNALMLDVGWYAPVDEGQTSLLTFSIGIEDGDINITQNLSQDVSATLWNVDYKGFMSVAGMDVVIGSYVNTRNQEIAVAETDETQYGLYSTVYLTHQLGLGAGIEYETIEYDLVDNLEDKTTLRFSLKASYDFDELAGFSIEFLSGSGTNAYSNINDQDFDETKLSLAGQFRF